MSSFLIEFVTKNRKKMPAFAFSVAHPAIRFNLPAGRQGPQSTKCFCKAAESFRWSLTPTNKNYFLAFRAFLCTRAKRTDEVIWARAIVC